MIKPIPSQLTGLYPYSVFPSLFVNDEVEIPDAMTGPVTSLAVIVADPEALIEYAFKVSGKFVSVRQIQGDNSKGVLNIAKLAVNGAPLWQSFEVVTKSSQRGIQVYTVAYGDDCYYVWDDNGNLIIDGDQPTAYALDMDEFIEQQTSGITGEELNPD